VHAGAAFVYACEWNPDAVEALEKGLRRNGAADRCTVLPGDNRMVRNAIMCRENIRLCEFVNILKDLLLFV